MSKMIRSILNWLLHPILPASSASLSQPAPAVQKINVCGPCVLTEDAAKKKMSLALSLASFCCSFSSISVHRYETAKQQIALLILAHSEEETLEF